MRMKLKSSTDGSLVGINKEQNVRKMRESRRSVEPHPFAKWCLCQELNVPMERRYAENCGESESADEESDTSHEDDRRYDTHIRTSKLSKGGDDDFADCATFQPPKKKRSVEKVKLFGDQNSQNSKNIGYDEILATLSVTPRFVTDLLGADVNWSKSAAVISLPTVQLSDFAMKDNELDAYGEGGAASEASCADGTPETEDEACIAGGGSFWMGREMCRDSQQPWSDLEDLLRHRLEESNAAAAVQLMTDFKDGFGGVSVELLSWYREELPKTPIIVFASSPPGDQLSAAQQDKTSPLSPVKALSTLNAASFLHYSFNEISGHNSPIILSDSDLWSYPPVGDTSNDTFSSYKHFHTLSPGFIKNSYDCSAVLSAAFHCLTFPFVKNPRSLASLMAVAVPPSLPLFSACLSLPLPSISALSDTPTQTNATHLRFPQPPFFSNSNRGNDTLMDFTPGFWDMGNEASGISRLGNPFQWGSYMGVKESVRPLFERLLCLPRKYGSLLFDDTWTKDQTFVEEYNYGVAITFPETFTSLGKHFTRANGRECPMGTIVHAAHEKGNFPSMSAEGSNYSKSNIGLSTSRQLYSDLSKIAASSRLRELFDRGGGDYAEFSDIWETVLSLYDGQIDEESISD